jgi:hypothetical protein
VLGMPIEDGTIVEDARCPGKRLFAATRQR